MVRRTIGVVRIQVVTPNGGDCLSNIGLAVWASSTGCPSGYLCPTAHKTCVYFDSSICVLRTTDNDCSELTGALVPIELSIHNSVW